MSSSTMGRLSQQSWEAQGRCLDAPALAPCPAGISSAARAQSTGREHGHAPRALPPCQDEPATREESGISDAGARKQPGGVW